MLGPGEGYEGDQEQEERGHNPLLVLHLLLQGRYLIAALLATVFAVGAAVAGYGLTHPTFACTGVIHIRPVISPLLFNQQGTMPMYETFVQTQIMLLKSERCIDLAMNSPKWREGKRAYDSEAAARFLKGLDVVKDGEMIRVTFTDPDAETSKAAVGAIIDAFQQLTRDIDPENPAWKQARLEELKDGYEKKLDTARKQIADEAHPNTPEGLLARYNYKLTESNQAETESRMCADELNSFLSLHPELARKEAAPDTAPASAPSSKEGAEGADPATAKAAASDKAASSSNAAPEKTGAVTNAAKETAAATGSAAEKAATSATPPKPAVAASQSAATNPKPAVATQPRTYTPEQIALQDSRMRNLLQIREDCQNTLDSLLLRVGPNNPLAVQARNSLELADRKVTDYAAHWVAPESPTAGPDTGMTPQMKAEMLQHRADVARQRFQDASDEVKTLGEKLTKIREIQDQQAQNIGWLAETKQALEALRVQLNGTGRILIMSMGDRPVYKDKRLPVAAASGFGGAILGFGIIIVWGLLDRRLRTIDQARMQLKQGMRVLGMLPSLPKNLEDPSAASFAALCVHHIRMLLQVMPRLDGHPAIAVTSPSPGDGKTSLTMALALSYAASGKSTLLIDCDIVGAGLTRRVNAIIRRRIGQILIRENLLTAAELREALSAAQRTNRKLGEVLVDEGFVDAEQLAKALKTQGETSVGLLDVMRGEVLEDCVAETGTPRLWILPVGSALAEHGATISPEGFRSVLDQARKRFDVILVDTGPVPGAIESSVAASQVDGVVLTVSRGEQGPLVKRAAEHLRDIGGRALGVVFNRATPEDFSSSYSSMSKPSIPERVREKPGVADMQALGPVAAAVAGQQQTRSLKEGKE
jgi:Mrp family chromosome partitioning ATPase/uncharacterized protein involved in exopolysaccharide biosynthesis